MRQEMRIIILVLFFVDNDVRCCPLLGFLFHKSLFAEENERPVQITVFKSNTDRYSMQRSFFDISGEIVTIK